MHYATEYGAPVSLNSTLTPIMVYDVTGIQYAMSDSLGV